MVNEESRSDGRKFLRAHQPSLHDLVRSELTRQSIAGLLSTVPPGRCGNVARLFHQPLSNHDTNSADPVHVLSIDLGTSSTRAALYDRAVREIPHTAVSIPRSFTVTADGGAELDADEFCRHADEGVARTLVAAGDVRIVGVGLATFWHGLLGVNSQGNAVTPIYGWADTRAWREAAALAQQHDERAAHVRTGCRFHAGYWPAKLMWLRLNRPDQFARVAKWVSPGDYLLARWCGELRTSVSMGSATGLFDQHRGEWDEPMLAAVGIDRSMLPELAGDRESFTLRDEWRAAWPQLAEARFVPAIGDGAANNLGELCVTPDKAALMIGTSGAIRVVSDVAPAGLPSGLWQYRLDRDRVVIGGALSDGGGLFHWMRESLAIDLEGADLEAALGAMEPDGHGLTVLPFWSGERSTGWNSQARGGVFGLTARTEPLQILRAAMEGIAYRFAAIADQLLPAGVATTIYASGGALRESKLWAQILADVLQRPLLLSGIREASGRGAALFGLEVLRASADPDTIMPEVSAILLPDPGRGEIYQGARERQQTLRDTLFGPET